MNNPSPEKSPLRKHEEYAIYIDPKVPSYQGNPLIEALPPILTKRELLKQLLDCPPYSNDHRTFDAELRLQLILQVLDFFTPSSIHYHLAWQVDSLIRLSYKKRNPMDTYFWNEIEQKVESIDPSWFIPIDETATATSLSIIGVSGIGKSTSLLRILKLYKPVIIHSHYQGRHLILKQLVWLRLECPNDGSIRGLCLNFLQKVDSFLETRYYHNYANKRKTVDELIPILANIAAIHCIGLLVIDEIQNLDQAKSGGAKKMLNFFVQLTNTLNISIILVGTYKAWNIVADEFRQIRRGTGLGDLVWDPMQNDEVFATFVKSFWRYQYTQHSCPLTSRLIKALFEECQGITDYAIKIYLLAQVRAILTASEKITEGLIKSVAHDHLRTAREVLDALKAKDWKKLKDCRDVRPIDIKPLVVHAQLDLDHRLQTKNSGDTNQLDESKNHEESIDDFTPIPTQTQQSQSTDSLALVATEAPRITTPEMDALIQEPVKKLNVVLLEIGLSATKSKIATYELLKQRGYVKSFDEYL